jgi:hypothetical protein
LATFHFSPLGDRVLSSGTVKLMLVAVVDSWDKLRDGAVAALMQMPTPLPGLSSPQEVAPLLQVSQPWLAPSVCIVGCVPLTREPIHWWRLVFKMAMQPIVARRRGLSQLKSSAEGVLTKHTSGHG